MAKNTKPNGEIRIKKKALIHRQHLLGKKKFVFKYDRREEHKILNELLFWYLDDEGEILRTTGPLTNETKIPNEKFAKETVPSNRPISNRVTYFNTFQLKIR